LKSYNPFYPTYVKQFYISILPNLSQSILHFHFTQLISNDLTFQIISHFYSTQLISNDLTFQIILYFHSTSYLKRSYILHSTVTTTNNAKSPPNHRSKPLPLQHSTTTSTKSNTSISLTHLRLSHCSNV